MVTNTWPTQNFNLQDYSVERGIIKSTSQTEKYKVFIVKTLHSSVYMSSPHIALIHKHEQKKKKILNKFGPSSPQLEKKNANRSRFYLDGFPGKL